MVGTASGRTKVFRVTHLHLTFGFAILEWIPGANLDVAPRCSHLIFAETEMRAPQSFYRDRAPVTVYGCPGTTIFLLKTCLFYWKFLESTSEEDHKLDLKKSRPLVMVHGAWPPILMGWNCQVSIISTFDLFTKNPQLEILLQHSTNLLNRNTKKQGGHGKFKNKCKTKILAKTKARECIYHCLVEHMG